MTNEQATEASYESTAKAWIDEADYGELLRRWRFAPAGDPIFVGELGQYYQAVMLRKKAQTGDGGVSASKTIGWDKP